MAVKHVVTFGFGFADGVKFIPPMGFGLAETGVTRAVRFTPPARVTRFTAPARVTRFTTPARTIRFTAPDRDIEDV